jgi:hypothetical protein
VGQFEISQMVILKWRQRQKWSCLYSFLSSKLHETAEPVEKVQLANPGIFDFDKNQLLIGLRIRQKSQILGFSTGSLYLLCFQAIENGSIWF